MFESSSTAARARWRVAQAQERKYVQDEADIRERVRVRTHSWAALLDHLEARGLPLRESRVSVDVGAGPTSVFLAMEGGERHAVDPAYDELFQTLPFLHEIDQYRSVHFAACPVEDFTLEKPADVVFLVNVLDHVAEPEAIVRKAGALLQPNGTIVVVVDCYADALVQRTMRLFDVDLPHPHHFLPGDVVSLFEGHTLVLQDLGVMSQIDSAFPSRGKCPHVKLYRLDKFGRRMARDLRLWGKSPVGVFAAKYFLCYGLALCTAAARRREKLAHPLKKARLFVFQKQA